MSNDLDYVIEKGCIISSLICSIGATGNLIDLKNVVETRWHDVSIDLYVWCDRGCVAGEVHSLRLLIDLDDVLEKWCMMSSLVDCLIGGTGAAK